MPARFTLGYQWNDNHIRWLARLMETVPLIEGRMEICPGRLSAGLRFIISVAVSAAAWAIAAAGMQEWDSNLFALLLTAGIAAVTTAAAWYYGNRTLRAFRQIPDFVLSTAGLAIDNRLVRWQDVTAFDYRRRNLGGHVSSTCRLSLRDGGSLTLDLDMATLGPTRTMLLIDFYSSAAKAA